MTDLPTTRAELNQLLCEFFNSGYQQAAHMAAGLIRSEARWQAELDLQADWRPDPVERLCSIEDLIRETAASVEPVLRGEE